MPILACPPISNQMMSGSHVQHVHRASTATDDVCHPRGILKHKSMLSAEMQPDAAAAAATDAPEWTPQQQQREGMPGAGGASLAALQAWGGSDNLPAPETIGGSARPDAVTAEPDEPVPFPPLVRGPKPSRGARILGRCSPLVAGKMLVLDQQVAAHALERRGANLQPQMSRGQRLLAAARSGKPTGEL